MECTLPKCDCMYNAECIPECTTQQHKLSLFYMCVCVCVCVCSMVAMENWDDHCYQHTTEAAQTEGVVDVFNTVQSLRLQHPK